MLETKSVMTQIWKTKMGAQSCVSSNMDMHVITMEVSIDVTLSVAMASGYQSRTVRMEI